MGSLITFETASNILTLSSGIVAGMNLGLSITVVPGYLLSSDPLPSWRLMYNRAKNIALGTIFTSSITSIFCYMNNPNKTISNISNCTGWGYLATGVLSFSLIPITIMFIKPINDQLFVLEDKKEGANPKSINLIKSWDKFHWMRTSAVTLAFIIQAFAIGH